MKKLSFVLALILALSSLTFGAFASNDITVSTSLGGASDARISNIEIAAASIDGVYVPSGSYFSFNDEVGPRTSEYGFVNATNGRGVKVRGGGVSQVATTLYLALLKAQDIEFDEVKTYGKRFALSYVSDGELAIVTDYSNGIDFSFYNYGSDMTISMWTDNSQLYCELSYGGGSTPDYGYYNNQVITCGGFYVSGKSGLKSNVERAAESINGTVLYNGDTFSFNDTVGPRDASHGYVDAINGRGVMNCGGGVAQVASALWLAIKDYDDVVVTEKSTYGKKYNQSYVSSNADAILTDYKAGTDFAFRYVGDDPIIILFEFDDDYLECDIADYYYYDDYSDDDFDDDPEDDGDDWDDWDDDWDDEDDDDDGDWLTW